MEKKKKMFIFSLSKLLEMYLIYIRENWIIKIKYISFTDYDSYFGKVERFIFFTVILVGNRMIIICLFTSSRKYTMLGPWSLAGPWIAPIPGIVPNFSADWIPSGCVKLAGDY